MIVEIGKLRTLPELERAITLAAICHVGQVDLMGTPYILHPLRVMGGVATYDEKVAAALHDLVEDTDITLLDLKDLGFKEEIVAAVDALTKRDDEKYMDYVKRATEDPIAIKVKLSDLIDNLGKTEELPDDEVKDKRRKKYTKALKFVEDAISRSRK